MVPIRVEAGVGECALPKVPAALIAPTVETTPATKIRQHGAPESAITAREDALEIRRARVVPFEPQAMALQLTTQQLLACLGFLERDLRSPLKWRVWFRYEGRYAGSDGPAVPAGGRDTTRERDDPAEI